MLDIYVASYPNPPLTALMAPGLPTAQVTTCDLATHTTSTDCIRSMATPRHTFGAATAACRVYAIGHGRLGDEADTVEFFDPGAGVTSGGAAREEGGSGGHGSHQGGGRGLGCAHPIHDSLAHSKVGRGCPSIAVGGRGGATWPFRVSGDYNL